MLDHRPSLLDDEEPAAPWHPPRLVSYELQFKDDLIKVISDTNRREFAPSLLYLNKTDRRATLDFGVYQLQKNPHKFRKPLAQNHNLKLTKLN